MCINHKSGHRQIKKTRHPTVPFIVVVVPNSRAFSKRSQSAEPSRAFGAEVLRDITSRHWDLFLQSRIKFWRVALNLYINVQE